MTKNSPKGPILRLFKAKAKKGHAEELLANFATTSADVVEHEPGNIGYFFGLGVPGEQDVVFFASLWTDLDFVKARFGTDWQESFFPPRYQDIIEECSVQHINLSDGWRVDDALNVTKNTDMSRGSK